MNFVYLNNTIKLIERNNHLSKRRKKTKLSVEHKPTKVKFSKSANKIKKKPLFKNWKIVFLSNVRVFFFLSAVFSSKDRNFVTFFLVITNFPVAQKI
jgi:hypothetical protein